MSILERYESESRGSGILARYKAEQSKPAASEKTAREMFGAGFSPTLSEREPTIADLEALRPHLHGKDRQKLEHVLAHAPEYNDEPQQLIDFAQSLPAKTKPQRAARYLATQIATAVAHPGTAANLAGRAGGAIARAVGAPTTAAASVINPELGKNVAGGFEAAGQFLPYFTPLGGYLLGSQAAEAAAYPENVPAMAKGMLHRPVQIAKDIAGGHLPQASDVVGLGGDIGMLGLGALKLRGMIGARGEPIGPEIAPVERSPEFAKQVREQTFGKLPEKPAEKPAAPPPKPAKVKAAGLSAEDYAITKWAQAQAQSSPQDVIYAPPQIELKVGKKTRLVATGPALRRVGFSPTSDVNYWRHPLAEKTVEAPAPATPASPAQGKQPWEMRPEEFVAWSHSGPSPENTALAKSIESELRDHYARVAGRFNAIHRENPEPGFVGLSGQKFGRKTSLEKWQDKIAPLNKAAELEEAQRTLADLAAKYAPEAKPSPDTPNYNHALKNAETEMLRAFHGKTPIEKTHATMGGIAKQGERLYFSGKMNPEDVVREVTAGTRILGEKEVAVLYHYGNVLRKAEADAKIQASVARSSGDKVAEAIANARYDAIQDKLEDHYAAAVHGGTAQSHAFAFRKYMNAVKYSPEAVTTKMARAKGEPLTPEEKAAARADVENLHQTLAEIENAKARVRTRSEGGSQPTKAYTLKQIRAGEANTKYTKAAYDEALTRAREVWKTGALFPKKKGITPESFGDAITIGGFHYERGVKTFEAFRKQMIADLGDNIKPHLLQIFKQVSRDPKLAAAKERATEQIATARELRKTGEARPQRAPKLQPDPELRALIEQREHLYRIIDAKTKPGPPKTKWDTAANAYREIILSSPIIGVKLAAADIWNVATELPSDIIGIPFAYLRVGKGGARLRDIPGSAEGEGVLTLARGWGTGLRAAASREMLRNVGRTIKTGTNPMSELAGAQPKGLELGGIAGRFHGAMKVPLQMLHMEKGRILRTAKWERLAREHPELGIDLNDPEIQESIILGSANDAWRQILQNPNELATTINHVVNFVGSKNKAAGFALRTVFPITGVPSNILGRAAEQTGYGLLEGGLKLRKAAIEASTEHAMPTPKDADTIQRAFKYGGLGAVAMYIGLTQPGWFRSGGYAGKERNVDSKGQPLANGEVEVVGHKLPYWMAHTSFVGSINYYATLKRNGDDMASALGYSAVGLAGGLPGSMTITDSVNAWRYGGPGRAFGSYLSSYIPQLVQFAAKESDPDAAQGRAPETGLQEVEQDLPWLRELVPLKGSRGGTAPAYTKTTGTGVSTGIPKSP